MANPWDNDPVVSPAPQAAAQPPAGPAPWASDPVVAASPPAAPAAGGNPWDHDPVVSPAPPQDTSTLGQLAHQGGLFVRGMVQGAAALPGAVADAVTAPINAGLDATLGAGNGFRFQRTSDALGHVMDASGVAAPQTATERVVQDTMQGVGGAAGGVGLGAAIKATASGPFTQAIGTMLTEAPKMQMASAATGSAAQGAVREAGGGEGAQLAAGVAGSLVPMAAALPRAASGSMQLQQAARQAREAGFVIPPADLNPGPVAQVASAVSGKVKTSQTASAKNQEITNTLARRALGLPEDQPLTIEALQQLRNEAAQAYEPISNAGIVTPSPGYANALDKAVEPYTSQLQSFPDRKLPSVVDDIQSLKTPQFDSGDAVNTIRVLRSQADTAYRGGDALAGSAYKSAARALEDQLESHLVSQGASASDLLDAFRNGRTQIAKSYQIQKALNPATGDVNAGVLAAALKRGKPLTGEMRTIAEAAQAFPKATQSLKEAPGSLSAVDMGGAALSALASHSVAGLAAPLLRPAARTVLLSEPVQNRMVDNMVRSARQGGEGVPAALAGAGMRASQTLQDQGQQQPHLADGGEVFKVYPAAAKARRDRGLKADIVPVPGGFSLQQTGARFADGGEVASSAPASSAQAADIDARAHQAATSPQNDLPEPTDAQAKAGNYKVGRVRVQGMNISIENPEGSTRRGVDENGTPWESKITAGHYGYVRKSMGADGDHVDAFVGPNPESKTVHVIDQLKPDGSFDEHKSLIGYHSADAAKSAYLQNYPASQESRIGAMTSLPVAAFKAWVTSGKLKEPLAWSPSDAQGRES